MSRVPRVVALVAIAAAVVATALHETVAFVLHLMRLPRGRGRHAAEATPAPQPARLLHETDPQATPSHGKDRTGATAEPSL